MQTYVASLICCTKTFTVSSHQSIRTLSHKFSFYSLYMYFRQYSHICLRSLQWRVNQAAVCINIGDLSLSAASLGIWSFRTIFTICIGSKTTQRDAGWVKNGCSAKLDKLWGVGVRGMQMHWLLPLIWKAWRLIICTNRHTGKGPTKQSLCQIIH